MPSRHPQQNLVTGTFLCPTCESRQLFVRPSLGPVMEASWMIKPKFVEPIVVCQRCETQVPMSEVERPRYGVEEEHDFSVLRLLCGITYVLNHASVPIASQQRIRALYAVHCGHELVEAHLSEELISQARLGGRCEPCLKSFALHFSAEHRGKLVRIAAQVAADQAGDREMASSLVGQIGKCLEVPQAGVKRALSTLEKSA